MPTDQATYDASVENVETKKVALEDAKQASNTAILNLRQVEKDYNKAVADHSALVAPPAPQG